VQTIDAADLYRQACAGFDRLVNAVSVSQWDAPTTCPPWSVRDLVNHVAVENLWAAELFAGKTIESVGQVFEGDQLGAVPLAGWTAASQVGPAAAAAPEAMARTVHLSFGDVPGREYAMQLFADHLVHSWDLATAIGADAGLDRDLVRACRQWFSANEDAYRAAGAIGPRPPIPPDADDQTELLAAFGRTA